MVFEMKVAVFRLHPRLNHEFRTFPAGAAARRSARLGLACFLACRCVGENENTVSPVFLRNKNLLHEVGLSVLYLHQDLAWRSSSECALLYV